MNRVLPIVVLGLLLPGAALAQDQLSQEVLAIARELRCPVCQGLSVADSESELARQMRTLIAEKIQSGQSREEIIGYFVERYGQWILLSPPKQGVNLVLWVLPFVAIGAGAWVLVRFLRRRVRRQVVPPALDAADAAYVERLRQELEKSRT